MKPPSVACLLDRRSRLGVVFALGLSLHLNVSLAADRTVSRKSPNSPAPKAQTNEVETLEKSVEALAALARNAVVTVGHETRGSREESVGTGFVISRDGLIATCLHVIGEGRPIHIKTADGRALEVTEIYAWDRKLDLAVMRVSADNLPALRLGDSEKLKQGASVVAIGNPLGLEQSIVEGVVSARREFDGVEMIQLAIPIEQGNSGGPLLDRGGRVHGLLTMKSMISRNLGFATPVSALKLLLDKPNPMPIQRWLAQGVVDKEAWTPLLGAQWAQRAGRIEVSGFGEGFGGRAMLLSKQAPPAAPYELGVMVKLENESGAAGLMFASDGGDRNYGFYPTGGQLRLTRFDGPSVNNWTILSTVPSEFYRPGDWNTLKVRVEAGHLLCYVNGHLAIESNDDGLTGGSVGLTKFRDTSASFKHFAVGRQVESSASAPPPELAAQVEKLTGDDGAELDPAFRETLLAHHDASLRLLRERASRLERGAERLRRLAETVHADSVGDELLKALAGAEEKIDLARAAFLVSKLDNPDLDVAAYLGALDDMARQAVKDLPSGAGDAARVAALTKYLFAENGYHGSRLDYYNRANSYLDKVIDDHEGIPITLSVLYTELARRAGLTNVFGIPVPTHFMVKFAPAGGAEEYIDVFEGGRKVTRTDIAEIALDNASAALREEHLQPATKRQIVVRMLRNLFDAARRSDASADGLRYLNLIVRLTPDSAYDRLERGMLRLQNGDRSGAKEDFRWLLDHEPPGLPLERVAEIYRSL